MLTVIVVLLGLAAFTAGAAILGSWLRRHLSKDNAERSSRWMHFLFFAGLIAPGVLGFFYPGYARLDEILGFSHLPAKTFFLILGLILSAPGLYLMALSNQLIRKLGSGANAFRLTRRIVSGDIYLHTRNPMSLGFYLLAVSTGLITSSTFATLGALLGVIPAHLFFLKYFEELELELRFGQEYLEYKRKVPFLFPGLKKAEEKV